MNANEYQKETMAKAIGRSLPISTRHSVEICSFIRGKNLQKMKSYLESVIEKEKAIPFKRYNKGVGHKPGMGPGRYPIKAASDILMLLKSAESNAQSKGIGTANLIIAHARADKAGTNWHYGRKRARKMKRSHVEIILKESVPTKVEKKEDKK